MQKGYDLRNLAPYACSEATSKGRLHPKPIRYTEHNTSVIVIVLFTPPHFADLNIKPRFL